MLHDIADSADKWGNNGKDGRIDPFTEIYHVSFLASWFFQDLYRVCVLQLVFIMTARMITCHDLTKNEADLKKISELFATLQNSATPASLLLPWFPSPARRTGRQASTDMYTILYTYIENRRHAEPTSDAIDIFIADGETTQTIVEASSSSEVA
jgi:cytochrome P450